MLTIDVLTNQRLVSLWLGRTFVSNLSRLRIADGWDQTIALRASAGAIVNVVSSETK